MSDEKKQYDTDDLFISYSARLSQDPKVFPSQKKDKDGKPLPPLVLLSFPSNSRKENTRTTWYEAKVRDFDANIASYLKQGDVLPIEGKPYEESYQHNGETKWKTKLENAKIHISVDLLMKLKERGFVPGQAKGASGGKSDNGYKASKPAGGRKVQDVDFGDEE